MEWMNWVGLSADVTGLGGIAVSAFFAWLAWQAGKREETAREVREATEAAHRAAHSGWRTVVVSGETVLFQEELTVEEADNLLNDDRTAAARTGEARRLGQSAITALGNLSVPSYEIATVEQDTRTVTFHLERDPGFQTRKPATPPAPKPSA